MMNGIQFQSVQTPNALSSELRSVIRDNVLQFYVQGNGMDVQEEALGAGAAPGCEGWGLEDPAAYGILGTVGENGIQKRPVPTIAGDYGLYYDNFYHAMNGEAELLVNPEDSIAVLQIMEAAIRSAASHKREKI